MFARTATLGMVLLAAFATGCSQAPSAAAGFEMVLHLECKDGVCPSPDDVDIAADLVEQRLDPAFAVVPDPERGQIVVRGPETADRNEVLDATRPNVLALVPIPPGDLPPDPGTTVTHEPLLAGTVFTAAQPSTSADGTPAIELTLHPDAAPVFERYAGRNVGNYFAVTLDGVVLAAQEISQAIGGGTVEIAGGMPDGLSPEVTNAIVQAVETGPLPFPLVEVTGS
jgi:preprotein translocase subunit SecD